MKTDPRVRFTETVDDCRRYRPSYPDALVDWGHEQAGLRPGARVLDVGCVTGIASRLFARRAGGACVVFWNERTDETPFLRAYERLLREHCSEYPVASSTETIRSIRARPTRAGPISPTPSASTATGSSAGCGRAPTSCAA